VVVVRVVRLLEVLELPHLSQCRFFRQLAFLEQRARWRFLSMQIDGSLASNGNPETAGFARPLRNWRVLTSPDVWAELYAPTLRIRQEP
jgi:hypothetical protein